MHQIEVQVVSTEVLERSVNRRLDIFGIVAVVPQLGGNEDFGAGNAALLDGFTYSWFGPVDTRSIDVTVSSLESIQNGIFLRVGVLPSAKSDGS